MVSRTIGLAELLFPSRDLSPSALVRALSEPESGPPAENLISNEDSYVRAAGDLARRDLDRGVYLGVGPDQNFSLIAASRPSLALIVDYRRRNLRLHLLHKALMALSANREEYLSRLMSRRVKLEHEPSSGADLAKAFGRVPIDRERLRALQESVVPVIRPLAILNDDDWQDLATIHAKLAGPGMSARFLGLPGYPTFGAMISETDRKGQPSHFLSSEDRYRVVRELELGDRVLPVVGDFAGKVAMPRIAKFLHDHSLVLSVVYVSDVEFFLMRAGAFDAYVANLNAFPRSPKSVIVRTSTMPIAHRERVDGDRSTTIVRDLSAFLADAKAGRFRAPDDLFAD